MALTSLVILRRTSACPLQRDVAKALGVTAQRVMNVESGRSPVGEQFLVKLAKIYRVPVREVRRAYLESRNSHLSSEMERVTRQLAEQDWEPIFKAKRCDRSS